MVHVPNIAIVHSYYTSETYLSMVLEAIEACMLGGFFSMFRIQAWYKVRPPPT